MTTNIEPNRTVWKMTPGLWGLLLLVSVALGILFFDGLVAAVKNWLKTEEYSHGILIPPIVLFLIWQRKDQLEQIPFRTSWIGVGVVLLGLVGLFVGELTQIFGVINYSFVIVLMGALWSFMGGKAFKLIWVPLVILFFSIPLPNFLYHNLSSQLQLISSQLGVAFIRLFDISVYLEGNVIDLGDYKLQVVDACSGLRYLFPLMTLGFIAAYFFKGALWKRAVIFLSSIPITILMNSLRIGMIGITVEYWGVAAAEGLLHDFEGWAVFMACTAMLILEMWALAHVGSGRMPLREAFGLDFPAETPEGAEVRPRKLSPGIIVSGIVIVASLVGVNFLNQRADIIPQRTDFSAFPLQIDGWAGTRGTIEQIYLDALDLTDYVEADFVSDTHGRVNFYVAYYESQKKGAGIHSPRNCLPGGGWRIENLSQPTLDDVTMSDAPLRVNRVLIKQGDYTQLVYYWFKQRDRLMTNEYVLRGYLLWDALTRSRTDGALIRLTTTVPLGEDIRKADERLTAFAKVATEPLKTFVPD